MVPKHWVKAAAGSPVAVTPALPLPTRNPGTSASRRLTAFARAWVEARVGPVGAPDPEVATCTAIAATTAVVTPTIRWLGHDARRSRRARHAARRPAAAGAGAVR